MIIKSYGLQALNFAVNNFLALDPEVRQHLTPLSGKVITVHVLPWHAPLQIVFESEQLNFTAGEVYPAQLKITGTPLNLLGSILAGQNTHEQWLISEVSIAGDINLGRELINILHKIDLAWEEYFAQIFGDLIAHNLSQVAQKITTWSRHAGKRMIHNISEYLQEESSWLVPASMLTGFLDEVDELRLEVDRLAAKIQDLK